MAKRDNNKLYNNIIGQLSWADLLGTNTPTTTEQSLNSALLRGEESLYSVEVLRYLANVAGKFTGKGILIPEPDHPFLYLGEKEQDLIQAGLEGLLIARKKWENLPERYGSFARFALGYILDGMKAQKRIDNTPVSVPKDYSGYFGDKARVSETTATAFAAAFNSESIEAQIEVFRETLMNPGDGEVDNLFVEEVLDLLKSQLSKMEYHAFVHKVLEGEKIEEIALDYYPEYSSLGEEERLKKRNLLSKGVQRAVKKLRAMRPLLEERYCLGA